MTVCRMAIFLLSCLGWEMGGRHASGGRPGRVPCQANSGRVGRHPPRHVMQRPAAGQQLAAECPVAFFDFL